MNTIRWADFKSNTSKLRGAMWDVMRAALLGLTLAGMLGGCATPNAGNAANSYDERDPVEGVNRAVFAFNQGLDTVLIRPMAVGYEFVLPTPIRTGVGNFFDNIGDVFVGVNNLLQGKVADAASDLGRVAINSTLGIFGLFDIASEAGLEKHEEDFGQTFGRWGVGDGPYLVVPVFGPRTTRDTLGLVLDMKVDPVGQVDHVPTRNTLTALRLVNTRATLLPADKVIEEAALDKYSYMRDAYLQRRRNLIYDGSPPRDADMR
ncbi:MAG TPA: VacJ family lipoprotein [Rhodocyclaceae bacterium]|nr:VacJ family lipoprotein [Rhodocyclaceae bacterium]